MMVHVALRARALSQQSSCSDALEPGIGSSASALTSWLATLPDLVTSQPSQVTIDGHHGLQIDASVAPGWITPCDRTGDWASDGIAVDRFAFTLGFDASASNQLVISGEGHARYIVLDAGNGDNIVIEVSAPDQASFDDLVAAAMPVIESFHFTPESQ
jgi:hypothetical protein